MTAAEAGPVASRPRPRAPGAGKGLPPRTFLLVDDTAFEREIMARLLQEAFPGSVILQAGDTTAARPLYGEAEVDCVLIDYSMPGQDGLSFAEEMRAARPHLPIVLVTGHGDEMLAARAFLAGVSDYIPKARITADSIHRTVARAIHNAGLARVIEEQRREIEDFAYSLAHDFKQPLRQIRTFSLMASEEVERGEVEAARGHLAFLNSAAQRLSRLVDVMSQYTLLSARPEIEAVDLGEAIADLRASLGAFLEEGGRRLLTEGEAVVQANPTLLGQVLQNLVVNGLTYNTDPAPCVTISVETDAERHLIRVRDNGLGIAAEDLAKIFEAHVRLHPASAFPGTGLGLALARKAVLSQGGDIWCQSEPGRGSTFFVELPVGDAVP